MKKANKTNSFAKRFFALAMALFLSFGLLPGITSKAADSADYKYVYAGLTWAEYWKSEGVYNATILLPLLTQTHVANMTKAVSMPLPVQQQTTDYTAEVSSLWL